MSVLHPGQGVRVPFIVSPACVLNPLNESPLAKYAQLAQRMILRHKIGHSVGNEQCRLANIGSAHGVFSCVLVESEAGTLLERMKSFETPDLGKWIEKMAAEAR